MREVLLLRWPAVYVLVYIVNLPMGDCVNGVGRALFGMSLSVPVFPGRADTAFNYVLVFCQLAVSLIAAVVWSGLDPDWKPGCKALAALRTLARYWLAWTLLVYGAVKLAPLQFPSPDLDRLLQPVGQCSPMGLMWTFMGASQGYVAFTGALEVVAAALLLCRRTTVPGALLGVGVMAHVVALNLSYDLPVKLFSSHLALVSLWLLTPDIDRLRRAVLGLAWSPGLEQQPRTWRPAKVLKVVTIAVLVVTTAQSVRDLDRLRHEHQSPASLRGSWRPVEGAVLPEGAQWCRLIVPSTSGLAVQDEWGRVTRYSAMFPANPGRSGMIRLSDWTRPGWSVKLRYSLDGGQLRLRGVWDGRRIDLRLHREALPPFLLQTRGFHWVNERPANM